MKSPPRVVIIILNWNRKEDTSECLQSIEKLDYSNYDVFVVDNGSTDGSPEVLRKRFPYITLIENKKNLGFAQGNNIGIDIAVKKKADYVLILNNDTIVDKNMLNALIDASESDRRIGIVGPKMYYYDDPKRIWAAGAKINFNTGEPTHIGVDEIDRGQYDALRDVDYIPGCGLLIKREVIDKIGLLDARFFSYCEDSDWCTRAKKKGYRVVYVPTAKMWHKVARTSVGGMKNPKVCYQLRRNMFLFMRKHASRTTFLLFLLYITKNTIGSFKDAIFAKNWNKMKATIYGFIHGFIVSTIMYVPSD